jgi:hypothetical protein
VLSIFALELRRLPNPHLASGDYLQPNSEDDGGEDDSIDHDGGLK